MPLSSKRRRNKIIESLEEALAHARGEPTGVRATTYLVPRQARPSLRPDGIVEISRPPVLSIASVNCSSVMAAGVAPAGAALVRRGSNIATSFLG